MFSDYDLQKYAERQKQSTTNKYDLSLRNALEEEKLKSKNAKERQDSVNVNNLEQEKMRQEGQTSRQSALIASDENLRKAQTDYYGAQIKGIEADNKTKGLSFDYQKAVQPSMIEEQKAASKTNIQQAKSFGTYYSNLGAEGERKAVLGGYDVSKEGVVSNKPDYLDPTFGRGNLQADLKAMQENDSSIRNNENIKPDLKPKLVTKEPLSRLSNGQLPNANPKKRQNLTL